MINPNKRRKWLKNFKPETLRPIKRWADLTPDEQNFLSQEYLALTMFDFKTKVPKAGNAVMTLSLKEIQDALFLANMKDDVQTKEVNLAVKSDDHILSEPVLVRFDAFIDKVVAAATNHGLIKKILSNKMQRIRLYHAMIKEKNAVEFEAIRQQAELDYEDFMDANKDKMETDEDKLRLMEFMITMEQPGGAV